MSDFEPGTSTVASSGRSACGAGHGWASAATRTASGAGGVVMGRAYRAAVLCPEPVSPRGRGAHRLRAPPAGCRPLGPPVLDPPRQARLPLGVRRGDERTADHADVADETARYSALSRGSRVDQ